MALLHSPASFAQPARGIAEGDLVVVYEGFDSMKSVRVAADGQYNNKYGSFVHKDWVGRPFGSKATARKGNGWVILLAPTPELWTSVLRHRTQILYAADIAMVVALLELRPGAVVLESGTGSGSLTHSLARAVAPAGHVWTFEFHEQRSQLAREEFAANGLGGVVTVTQRDIEEGGFPEALHGKADAVFLDLPGPQKVVPSAARCVRPDGMFCSFSPCIEQVQRTCEALNSQGFRDIRTMEVLLRQHEVIRVALQTDMEAAPAPKQAAGKKQQREQGGRSGSRAAKRQKTNGGAAEAENGEGAEAAAGGVAAASVEAAAADAAEADCDVGQQQQKQQAAERQVVSKPVPNGRGHTGYLTFARRVAAL
ncbi:tRNA (adenine(58)-N(1))-methyltransferase catalytic subunit trmt61a [Micractinium conductrix]|uniref:tRNA (adenine(58)-N(1))-methyltransferase n=1 Tax=Micractinium conductrix TaxID=554055 RepID=A0A2P6VHZ9_9CHLO|nr:tRNA (adenine(58)-N(1))-methyltransferase catalytic subunit trmt61a [Micractinium conductrix]|eukprot:PSC73714.1 tRNA (adenine(58)-N(1))-methyltransferase catalytic subunit trmt61a [Micractinium conductrix]